MIALATEWEILEDNGLTEKIAVHILARHCTDESSTEL